MLMPFIDNFKLSLLTEKISYFLIRDNVALVHNFMTCGSFFVVNAREFTKEPQQRCSRINICVMLTMLRLLLWVPHVIIFPVQPIR